MRPLTFSPGVCRDPIAEARFRDIENASQQHDPVQIAQAFTTGSYTPLRTLNVGTSTLAQTQALLATLIDDFKRGGTNRTT